MAFLCFLQCELHYKQNHIHNLSPVMSQEDWTFKWNWTEFCPTGIKPFVSDSNDLLPCFQEIVLQLPIYTIFAAISAFYFGSYTNAITRNVTQLRLIHLRVAISIVLALLPVCKIFVFHHTNVQLSAVDVLVVCTECVMWIVHCGECN